MTRTLDEQPSSGKRSAGLRIRDLTLDIARFSSQQWQANDNKQNQ
jgi:hypothetical protein